MFRIKILLLFLMINFQGCTQILEPVSFIVDEKENTLSKQEEFNINIKSLTFKNALKANKDPYARRLMLTGSGTRANVFDEADFLTTELPEDLINNDYQLGFGDKLSFSLITEFNNKNVIWPKGLEKVEYTLGPGDKLKFVNYTSGNVKIKIDDETGAIKAQNKVENVVTTTGVVGSNGKILLLALGNLTVKDRTLDDVRTEIRNILIRNGLTPNFQLEISDFGSKKAYLTLTGLIQSSKEGAVFPLSNVPITLQEIALGAGLSKADGRSSLIVLTRNKEVFRYTGEQLFDLEAPDVIILDRDKINISINANESVKTIATVGSNENILLPKIGNLIVANKTLNDVSTSIKNILIKKGYMPKFQLELIEFKSKKVYFYQKNVGSKLIPLTNFKTTLKDIILSNIKMNNEAEDAQVDGIFAVTLKRGKKTFRITLDKILDINTPDIWIHNNDQIEVKVITYKSGEVYALSGVGNALIFPINPSKRETLANILFTPNGAFSNKAAKRSEVYLLRGRNPAIAYHLDAQNVSRILVAAKTELRPNDIIYVAERPIISFSRVLKEITPLRLLLRDLDDGNIP